MGRDVNSEASVPFTGASFFRDWEKLLRNPTSQEAAESGYTDWLGKTISAMAAGGAVLLLNGGRSYLLHSPTVTPDPGCDFAIRGVRKHGISGDCQQKAFAIGKTLYAGSNEMLLQDIYGHLVRVLPGRASFGQTASSGRNQPFPAERRI